MNTNQLVKLNTLIRFCENDVEFTEIVMRELKALHSNPFVDFVNGFKPLTDVDFRRLNGRKLPSKFALKLIASGRRLEMEINPASGRWMVNNNRLNTHTEQLILSNIKCNYWEIVT